MFVCLYNAFIISMLISSILFQNTWLEMRVNLGFVFLGLILILFLLQISIKSLRRFYGTFLFAFFSLVISCAGIFFILGDEGIKVIPASIVREGIMQNKIPFSLINYVLIAIAVIGLVIVFFTNKESR